jgi:hypothetical protein
LENIEDFSGSGWELYSENGKSKVFYKPDTIVGGCTEMLFGGE